MPDTAELIADHQDKKKKPHAPRDPAREVVETIVFVVVLVLLLKLFVTEAFVIPTGSMAETLYGYQKIIVCQKCGHEFPVNSHDEVEGNQQTGRKMPLHGYCCPNCRHVGLVADLKPIPDSNSGDRVLVLKPLFHLRNPKRGDVVVFKYPEKPQDKHTAQNYIKRAKAFGGETLAIHRGDLFVTKSLSYPANDPNYPRPDDPDDLWQPRYMYSTAPPWDSNPLGMELFDKSRDAGFPAGTGGFEIVRKEEDELLADRRIVWDNDKQPKDLAGKVPPRWYAPADGKDAWKGDDNQQPKAFAHTGADQHWIRYRHLAMPWKTRAGDQADPTPATDFSELANQQPTFVDNFLGYNAGRDYDPATGRAAPRDNTGTDRMWVGDLILECEADLGGGAEVVLELSKGVNRFRATFANGSVALARTGRGGETFGNSTRPCKLAEGKPTRLRFANVDCRLWVWVDGQLIDFGAEADYQPVEPVAADNANPEGWTEANDVFAPAGIGAKGQVTIRNITLHRDVYYTRTGTDHAKADIFYVQPGHTMCLGDNSAQSSDSRRWGTVPDRLMLGKAVFVFYPIALDWRLNFPPVRFKSTNRVGFIK